MYIKDLHLPWESKMLEDFYQCFDTSSISALFSYNPWIGENFHRRYQFLQEKRKEPFPRTELVRVIRTQYGQRNLHPQVELNLQRFEDERSCVVIGGQQAGLLTGPLFTLYKAATIIQLAKREEERLGIPVIPVFWIAGEDHDFAEVNHIWIRDFEGRVRKQSFDDPASPEGNRTPVSNLPIDQPKMLAWLEALSEQLPDTLHKSEWMKACEESISSSQTWGQFFLRMMQRLFDQWGLLCIDSNHQALRQLERKFFIKLIQQNQPLRESIRETEQFCKQHQYQVPVKVEENHAHLFVHVRNERFPLFNIQNRWMTRDGMHRWNTSDLLQVAEETPERLSNNVLTRPLMQEYLFPTLAFVGGTTEIAYWSLLKRAFSLMDLEMPIVYPRTKITLVDPTSSKRARHFQLSFKELLLQFEQKKDQWLNKQIKIDLDHLFQQAAEAIEQSHDQLVQQLEHHLAIHLRKVSEKNRAKIKEQLDYLQKYVKRTIQEQYQTELRRMDELAVRILPLQKPQERVYNLIQYWNEHGLKWLDQIVQQQQLLEPIPHHLVYI